MMEGITASWILADCSLQSFLDSGNHHILAMKTGRALQGGGLSGWWSFIRGINVSWPPGTFVVHGLFGALLGDHQHTLRLVNLLYLPLLLWGVYRLGLFFGGRWTAVLAAVLSVSGLGLAFHLRHVCIDNTATVVVVFGMLALMAARRRGRPGWLVLFGVVSGVGLLFRVQYLFFVLLPAAGLAAIWIWSAQSWRRRAWIGACVLLSAAAALLISAPYWTANFQEFLSIALSHLSSEFSRLGIQGTGAEEEAGLASGLPYYGLVPGKLVGWPVVLAALGALPWLLRRRRRTVYLLLWVAGGLLIYSLTVAREPRYLLPLVPALALLAALGTEQLSRPWLRGAATALLLFGTTGPTLIIAGNGWNIPDQGPLSWLAHHEFFRAPDPGRRQQEARAMAAALRAQFARKPGRQPYVMLSGSQIDELPELYIFVAPELPQTAMASIYNFSPDDYPHWRAARAPNTVYYMLSLSRRHPFTQLWKGTYSHRPMRLYEVPQRALESIIRKTDMP